MTLKAPSSSFLYNSGINIRLISLLTNPSLNATANLESCQAADKNLIFGGHSVMKALQHTCGFTPGYVHCFEHACQSLEAMGQ